MKKSLLVLLAAFGGVVFALANPVQAKVTVTDTTVHRFPLTANGDLSVSNVNGNILIEGWDRDSVRVTVEKIVTASRKTVARRFLRETKVIFDSDGTYLNVEPRFPRGANGNRNFFDWIFGTGQHASVRVNFHILVPRNLNADIESVNGRIEVRKIVGELDAKCTNGRVQLYDVSGQISAKTVNGRIRVTVSDAGHLRNLTLKTVNGSVAVWLPDDVGGKVNLSTLNGSITTDFPLEVRGKMGRHELRGRMGKGHARIRINTLNGSIRLLRKGHEEK
jgi:DUF4097 and DUF4098 domain-containing protein YvlB